MRRSLVATLPAVVLVAVVLLFESHMTPKSFAPSILVPGDYRLTQPFVWLRYCSALFLPVHLNVDTDLAPFHRLNAQALLGIGFLVALVGAIAFTVQRRVLYPIAYGLIWFVVTQLPTSLYPLSEVENDHRMFFSFPGLILAVVWMVRMGLHRMAEADRRRVRPVLVSCVLLLLCGYAWGVHVRNRVWHTEESLWLDDVQKSPKNGRGLMIYGLTQMTKGDYPRALDYFTQALAYTPNYPTLEINLGVVNGFLHHDAEAQRHFLRAIALAPNDDQTHAFYGRWLLGTGRTHEAIAQLQMAIALNPARPFAHEQMALALARHDVAPGGGESATELIDRSLALNQAGRYAESIAAAQAALRVDPGSAEAWNNIAAGNEAMQRWDEAIVAAQRAIALKPDFQLAKNNLAWASEQKRKGLGR